MYESFILIDHDCELKTSKLAQQLRRFYAQSDFKPKITNSETTVSLDFENWTIQLVYNNDHYVLAESSDLAEAYAVEHQDKSKIAKCNQRLEVSADDDPDLNYFNDWLLIVQCVESLATVYTFDLGNCQFI